ncbi:penicillin-insensitive murein endopeptidase [Candidatus Woesearchaeota archaeon]|nr:penicillin-insensitive murein endopeptidase [Candidatus Woesearchaeota archaeon]
MKKINKKSQLFMILLVFVTLTTVISVFLVLSEKRADVKNYLGEESMNLISGYQEEQKLLHAIQLQARFAYYQSVYDLALAGGASTEGAAANNCGKYRGFVNYYNDPEFQQCLPLDPEKELILLMNKEMKFTETGISNSEVTSVYSAEVKDNSVIGKANGSIAYTYDTANKVLNLGSIEIKQLSPGEYAQLHNYGTAPGTQGNSGVKEYPVCDKTEDVIIDLSQGKEKKLEEIGLGKIWVPAQALCGGEFPVFIMLHGHDANPAQYYVGESSKSRIDSSIKQLIADKKVYPVILAAPIGRVNKINGDLVDPWPADQFDIADYIAKIKTVLQQQNNKLTAGKVGIIGHSAANCYAGGLRTAVSKYDFYFVGSADGTCGSKDGAVGSNNYAKTISQRISNKDAIYVLMHRNSDSGDKSSETFMAENSIDDSADAIAKENYVSVVKKNDKEYYRYLLDPQKYGHMAVPKLMTMEVLQRFFTLEKVGGFAPYAAISQAAPNGCKRTIFNRDSESIGTVNCGALKNAVSFAAEREYYKSDHDSQKRYATVELVNFIEDIGCVLTAKYGSQGKIAVGQTSYEYGGKLYLHGDSGNAHSSHQSGRDADIGLFFRNEKQELISKQTAMVDTKTNIVDSRFDLDANWLFVKEFVKHDLADIIIIHGALEDALIAYAEQHNEDKQLIEKAKQIMVGGYGELGYDHRHHYHIRIKCPHGDNLCEKKYNKCDNYIAQAK